MARIADIKPPREETRLPRAGEKVGHFRIGPVLGSGAMGVVFAAEDEKLGRRVALKLLPAQYAKDPTRRARLLREARAAAAVQHPNVVTVFETGEENGRAYVVLELVPGRTLRRVLDERRLPISEAITMAEKIIEGLAHAHAAGLLHRDLKPENILVSEDGNPKIADFGLAKMNLPGTTLTLEGHVIGTPGYMAPEQARGETVDARADVFSFGAVFFEMLTGQPAFEGVTPADVISAVLRDEPRFDRLRIAGPVVADIVERCLRKDRDERIGSARELGHALAAFRAEPEIARRVEDIKARQNRDKKLLMWASFLAGLILTLSAIAGARVGIRHAQAEKAQKVERPSSRR